MNKFYILKKITISCLCLLILSCKTIPSKKISLSRNIMDQGKLTSKQLADYFLSQNPDFEKKDIIEFASVYIEEANFEGINSDVAFAQMCLETGYLRFGNLVTPEMNNFCGLGAMDAEHPGEVFETPRMGIRAHIQHLQAYGTTEDVKLNGQLIDPRYSWVHKTKFVQDIFGLAGTWATDKEYGTKLNTILCRMEELASK